MPLPRCDPTNLVVGMRREEPSGHPRLAGLPSGPQFVRVAYRFDAMQVFGAKQVARVSLSSTGI
jgi:hypothetical protein